MFDRFDDASRGPWGSLFLIVSLRARHWVVLGSIVTIALLAFEPFLQSVILFIGRNDISSRNLEARANRVDYLHLEGCDSKPFRNQSKPSSLDSFVSFGCSVPADLNTGFYYGIFRSPSADFGNRFITCSNGNCSWDPFPSIGVCSACYDLTPHIKEVTCVVNKDDEPVCPATNATSSKRAQDNETATNTVTQYRLPGLALTAGQDINNAVRSSTDPGDTMSFGNLSTLITAIQVIWYDSVDSSSNSTRRIRESGPAPKATECALYLCVNLYEATVKDGKLSEHVVTSWADRDPKSYRVLSNTTDNIDIQTDVESYEERFQGSHLLIPSNITIQMSNFYYSNTDILRSDVEIIIPKADREKYGFLSNSELQLHISQKAVHILAALIFPTMSALFNIGSPNLTPFSLNDNVTAIIGNVSLALTSFFRYSSNTSQVGITWEWETHISIQWNYLTLPLVSFVFGLVFCFLCILENRRLRLEPWKTDSIASLAHSVDTKARKELRDAYMRGTLEQAAQDMNVRLVYVHDGLELRKVE
ncbi:hypothetical protein F5Y19DRAFT_488037 [Xylariaceae sp. FL1651]|nr:hypothetical protein F5Y19DRAFT_488037 [Xylariaceae sp. FL1651]